MKERLFEVLKTIKVDEEKQKESYQQLIDMGVKYAFKDLSEEECLFVSPYIINYPNIYYNRYLVYLYNVKGWKKITNNNDEIKSIIHEYHKYFFKQYVGPFFYIYDVLFVHKEDISNFDFIQHEFINSGLSHFDFFKMINIDDGDYGNYPRGRVIYKTTTNEFIIYMDKTLYVNDDVIEDIRSKFNLSGNNVILRLDSHYTHDNL